jgi:hypothetical protein
MRSLSYLARSRQVSGQFEDLLSSANEGRYRELVKAVQSSRIVYEDFFSCLLIRCKFGEQVH